MFKRAISILMVTIFVIAVVSPPVQAQDDLLPAPTGPYEVGKTVRYWIDESREEMFSNDEGAYREIVVYIWYPAEEGSDGDPAPYFNVFSGPAGEEALATWPLLSWIRKRPTDETVQALVQSMAHAILDAPVSTAQTSYPVLVFSPGLSSATEEYTSQMEELASHGYVVVAISHPYMSGVTVFPDGRVVTSLEGVDLVSTAVTTLTDTAAQDITFVIDELETLNATDPSGLFSERLDLERIGAFGHSLGGWAATLAGTQDARLLAFVAEDGTLVEPLEQPTLDLRARPRCGPALDSPEYQVWSTDLGHQSFVDHPLWPLSIPFIGKLDGNRTIEIVRAYTLAFFDYFVKGEADNLVEDLTTDFPEMQIRVTIGDSAAPMPQIIASEDGAPVVIDDFESGTLDGWTLDCSGWGSWYIYNDGLRPPNPEQTNLGVPFRAPDPPQGDYAAVVDMDGPGRRILYRDLQLDGTYMLHLTVFYRNAARVFFSEDSLAYFGTRNQQFRIDLLDPEAEVDSLGEGDVLATIFATVEGDTANLDPTEIEFDLSPWAGQTVRLRLASVGNQGPLRAGVDNIYLEPVEP